MKGAREEYLASSGAALSDPEKSLKGWPSASGSQGSNFRDIFSLGKPILSVGLPLIDKLRQLTG